MRAGSAQPAELSFFRVAAQRRLILRNLPLVALALLLGALAATFSLLSDRGSDDMQSIVVAASDIKPGVLISEGQLRITQWPGGTMPAGAFRKQELLVGRVARQAIMANEPILEAKLASNDAKGGLSSLITPGKRAISVRVDEVIGVAGFALPGAYVDVMVSAHDQNNAPFSRIVLSRVKVVAAEQNTAGDPAQPKVVRAVTLELDPEDAEKLDLARNIGSLSLALRNEMDTQAPASGGVRLDDLVPGGSRIITPAPVAEATTGAPASLPPGTPPVRASEGPSGLSGLPVNAYGAEEIRGATSASGRS